MCAQAFDGFHGPFVVHSNKEKCLQKPYKSDRVLMVSVHYYDLSSLLLMSYLELDCGNIETFPDTISMNGRVVQD